MRGMALCIDLLQGFLDGLHFAFAFGTATTHDHMQHQIGAANFVERALGLPQRSVVGSFWMSRFDL